MITLDKKTLSKNLVKKITKLQANKCLSKIRSNYK